MAPTQYQNGGRTIPERTLAEPKTDASHRHLKCLKNSACTSSRSPENDTWKVAPEWRMACASHGAWNGAANSAANGAWTALQLAPEQCCNWCLQWCLNGVGMVAEASLEWRLKRAWNDIPHRCQMALERRLNTYKEACKSALNNVFLTPETVPERCLFLLPYYASQCPALLRSPDMHQNGATAVPPWPATPHLHPVSPMANIRHKPPPPLKNFDPKVVGLSKISSCRTKQFQFRRSEWFLGFGCLEFMLVIS